MVTRAIGQAVLKRHNGRDRLAVMEHLSGLSREAIVHFTRIDPVAHPRRVNEAFRQLAEVFEVDLYWGGGLPDGSYEVFDWSDGQTVKRNRRGESIVQWGIFGTAHQEDGRHFTHVPKPRSVDEALDYQPLEYFPQTVEQYRDEFQETYARMLDRCGEVCLPIPHHYTTLFHWPLAIFGFELLCEAGMQEDRFGPLIERFAEVSRRVTTAWAAIPGVEGFILHDDLAMTGGPIFAPDWYRRMIFPHYPAIFQPLRQAGVPVIFTSDGDINAFIDDIFAAGAEGLNFEYIVDLGRLVRDYGDKILIGNMNSHVLAAGPQSAIDREVQRCLEVGAMARRFVVNVGGQLTHDIPIAHLEHYLAVRKRLSRRLANPTVHN